MHDREGRKFHIPQPPKILLYILIAGLLMFAANRLEAAGLLL